MKRWLWLLVSTYAVVSCSTNPKKDDAEEPGASSSNASSEQSLQVSSSLTGGSSSSSSSPPASDRIGTFNLGIFGETKSTNSKLLQGLKTIAANYSILSVQEIRDVSGESCKRLLSEVSAVGLASAAPLMAAHPPRNSTPSSTPALTSSLGRPLTRTPRVLTGPSGQRTKGRKFLSSGARGLLPEFVYLVGFAAL